VIRKADTEKTASERGGKTAQKKILACRRKKQLKREDREETPKSFVRSSAFWVEKKDVLNTTKNPHQKPKMQLKNRQGERKSK